MWTSLVAVAGTLLGSLMTHLFQRRNTERAELLTRERQWREERLAAYGAFAGAVVDYRRAQTGRVFGRLEEPNGTAHLEARAESHRLRSAAEHELFRVRLVSDDPELTRCAEQALELTAVVHYADTKEQVRERGGRAEQALDKFITAASVKVRVA
ncbi:hypothetical protein ACTIVE_4306 [Actinomadura verrucosospora]|uniref:Uncharacterized protein n=2 Tax=Actinomadura verrucosospora TaxID=46165 RepID=A0A7D4A4Z8_ACTVE|nr:hypothetical protein ACTIVE_4306 [Actinomadura verrucosospora]